MTNLVGKLFGGGGGDKNALMKGFTETLGSQGGGIDGLIGKFDAAGMGEKARSWVGDGAKEPVTGAEVQQALGDQEIQQIADKAGMPPDQASEGLASILPDTVSKLTPGGKIPDPGELKQIMSKIPGL